MQRGENHHQSKLSDKKVLEIRRLLRQESATKGMLAKRFKVSFDVIHKIAKRVTWKHV